MASWRTVKSSLFLAALPAGFAVLIFAGHPDAGTPLAASPENFLVRAAFDTSAMAAGVIIFFGVVAPIFLTAQYHTFSRWGDYGKKLKINVDNHLLSRFFIIQDW